MSTDTIMEDQCHIKWSVSY